MNLTQHTWSHHRQVERLWLWSNVIYPHCRGLKPIWYEKKLNLQLQLPLWISSQLTISLKNGGTVFWLAGTDLVSFWNSPSASLVIRWCFPTKEWSWIFNKLWLLLHDTRHTRLASDWFQPSTRWKNNFWPQSVSFPLGCDGFTCVVLNSCCHICKTFKMF